MASARSVWPCRSVVSMPDGSTTPTHPRPHPDLAGWVLGSLEADDAEAFERHLRDCDDCRAELAELKRLGRRFAQIGTAVAACVALLAVLTFGNLGAKPQTADFALKPVTVGAMR